MPQEPTVKRAVSFFDSQNLFRHAKDAFGHHHPNYDPGKPATAVCDANGWTATGAMQLIHRATKPVEQDSLAGRRNSKRMKLRADFHPFAIQRHGGTSINSPRPVGSGGGVPSPGV